MSSYSAPSSPAPAGDEGRGSPFDYAKRFHLTLGVNLTMRCPLECAHCSVESGPWRREALDPDLILSRLREIGEQGKIKQLIVAGGEPFLALTLLRSVIEVAARYRIDTYVLTSAHWATGAARAARILAGLPGLTHLAVSADRYHLPFVPLSHVRHALLAAIECGVRPGLTIRLVDPDDPFLPELRAALGEDLMARVGVELGWVTPVGRGRDLPLPPHRQRPPTRELPAGACDLVHHPIVGSDGRVLACCNEGVARRNAPLQLGDLRAEPFTRMTERAEDDLLLHAIRLWGPKRLAEMVQARGLGDRLKGIYPRGDICALCDDLTGQPELVRVLRAELEARREEIVLARLVRFGEWAGTAAETVP